MEIVCYAKPGPRCATHARYQIKAAQQRLIESKNRVDILIASEMSPKNALSQEDHHLVNIKLRELTQEKKAAYFDLIDATCAFDGTRTGQKVLQDKISQSASNGDILNVEILQDRLDKASVIRALKMRMFKEKYPSGTPTRYGPANHNKMHRKTSHTLTNNSIVTTRVA